MSLMDESASLYYSKSLHGLKLPCLIDVHTILTLYMTQKALCPSDTSCCGCRRRCRQVSQQVTWTSCHHNPSTLCLKMTNSTPQPQQDIAQVSWPFALLGGLKSTICPRSGKTLKTEQGLKVLEFYVRWSWESLNFN